MRVAAVLLMVCSCAATRPATRVPTLRERSATIPAAKGDIRELYRRVAPATVLIKSRHGYGTGVIVDARGYILTNHHVIADSDSVDFKHRVTVELGAMNPAGYMEKVPGARVAWVLESDPAIDLAILKLDDPPSGISPVQIADEDPVPGEPVAALGHGGIGLLWSIRDGEVSSIGKLATSLAQLTVADDAERQLLAAEVPALVIQSSCAISPGDSGGPLVNRAGELVGVNAFLQSDPTAPVSANFHIHVAEVRKFLSSVPAQATPRAPDPVELSRGAAPERLDADRDGIEESTAYATPHGAVVFSVLGDGASVAVASDEGRTLVWVDELLTIEDAPRSGRGTTWDVKSPTAPKKLAEHALLFDRSKLTKAAAARFQAVERGVLAPFGLAVTEPLDVVPDPYAAAKWKLYDADRDKKIDSAFSGGIVLIDPRQALAEPITRAPIALVRRDQRAWCVLPDRTLASDDADSGAVTAGDQRGRLFTSLALQGFDEAERKRGLRAMKRLLPGLVTQGSPWPDPVLDVGPDVVVEDSGLEGLEYAVVSVVGAKNASLVFELDRATATPAEMERRARKGQGVDFAWVRRSQTEWFLYDTNRDGVFDVALFLPASGALEGFRLTNGAVSRAPELDGGRPVRSKLFEGEQRQALTALARVFFNAEVIEP